MPSGHIARKGVGIYFQSAGSSQYFLRIQDKVLEERSTVTFFSILTFNSLRLFSYLLFLKGKPLKGTTKSKNNDARNDFYIRINTLRRI
jgi:hypothetical protein